MKKLFTLFVMLLTVVVGAKAQEESMNVTPLSFEVVEDETVLTINNANSLVLRLDLTRGAVTGTYYLDQPVEEMTLMAGDVVSLLSTCGDYSSNFKILASKDVCVYGNPLSLVSRAEYKTMTDLSGCATDVLGELFSNGWDGNPHIKNHATKDIVLPATTLSDGCYRKMFQGTGLTRAPQLPATTMTCNCYNYMFHRCKDLTQAPELPATTLDTDCYYAMFYGCSALTEAPELPATTLAYECYGNMFRDCTSLTTAPVLPAPILEDDCYYWMFYGCTSLNYVKCLATDISASSSTSMFLGNVAPTGTFVKAPGMEAWTREYDGVPEGWTIVDDSEETGIKLTPTLSQGEGACYSLDGRRVVTLPTGLYIYKGKKIIVK